MVSGAGGDISRRRRDFALPLQIWFLVFVGLLSIGSFSFCFSNPSRILSPSAQFNGERRWFPAATSALHRLIGFSLPQPQSTSSDAILKVENLSIAQLLFPRSGSAQIPPEESSHWASLMAGDYSLGPSDAPCLVETSTAHGDSFFWVVFTWLSGRVSVVMLEVLPFSLDAKPHSPKKPSSSPTNISSLPSRHKGVLNEAVRRKLGFCLVGLVHFGPQAFFHRPIYKSGGPFPRTSRPSYDGPTFTSNRPRFFSIPFSTHPWNLISRHKFMSGRGLHSRLASPSVQGFVDHPPAALTHRNSLMARTPSRDLGPSVAPSPVRLSLAHDALLCWREDSGLYSPWLRSILISKLNLSFVWLLRYKAWNGRGLRSSIVSTSATRSFNCHLSDLKQFVENFWKAYEPSCTSRSQFLHDLEGPPAANLPVVESLLMQPSSSMERTLGLEPEHYLIVLLNHSLKRRIQRFSMRGQICSGAAPRVHPNAFTILLSSVACTGLEDASGFLLTDGNCCFSTSKHKIYVTTRFLHWGLTATSPSTHLSFASNPLSISLIESLSLSSSFGLKDYCCNQRGCFNSLICCTFEE